MPNNLRSKIAFMCFLILQMLHPMVLWGASDHGSAIVSGLHGKVSFHSDDGTQISRPVRFNAPISSEGQIKTSADADTQVLFGKRCLASVGPDSNVRFPAHSDTQSVVELQYGIIELASSKKELLDDTRCSVLTPQGIAVSQGGVLLVSVLPEEETPGNKGEKIDTFSVIDGEATISSAKPSSPTLLLSHGDAVQIRDGELGDPFKPEEPMNLLPICAVDSHCVLSKPLPIALSQIIIPSPIVVEQVIIPPTTTPPPPIVPPPPPIVPPPGLP